MGAQDKLLQIAKKNEKHSVIQIFKAKTGIRNQMKNMDSKESIETSYSIHKNLRKNVDSEKDVKRAWS